MNLHKVYYVMFVIVTVCNGFTVAEEKLAVTGSNVQLICPIKGNSNSSPPTWISWYKIIDSIDVLYADATKLGSSLDADLRSRLKITGDQTAGEYHLNISDVRTSDGGKYKCLLTGSFAPVFTNLTVITGPTSVMIENMTSDNKIHITEGQDMTIKCKALGGTPVPDILLQVLGTTSTGEQSAEHTFRPNSSIDGVAVTCQAGYKQINFYPLKTTAYIYLTSKPIVTPFASDILSTEETTKSLDVICISTGSRPAAAIYWFLGQKRTNITANSTSISKQESPTNKFTVTSTLKYSVNRKFNGQNLTCGAMNIAGTMERSLFLNIKYAPSVTVENITFSQSQSSRQIHSSLESNPLVNICTWNHRSKYGENIRAWNNNNQTLTLPTLPEDQRYQDTGEYICTADNGIVGMNGQLKQTGSGYIRSINALPVITADNNFTQYGKFGKSTELKVNVYSIPKYSMISWYIGNTQLVSDKYDINEEPVIVKDVFHGVKVQLDGYRVTLTIRDLQIIDFTNYTLRLYNGTQYVQHDVTLESASAPETPSNFTITDSGETSITVQWIPGYDGGQTQTFFIEYRITGSILWTSQEIKSSNKLDTHNLYTLSGLQDQTLYDLRMFAKNIFNQSQHTDIEKIKTTQKGMNK